MKTALVNCYEGIGDSIYARPFIRQLCQDGYQVYLKTALPEMFSDLPVMFIEPEKIEYRTQLKSFSKSKVDFCDDPPQTFNKTVFYRYGPKDLKRRSIIGCMERAFGYEVGSLSPHLTLPPILIPHNIDLPRNKKLAVVRAPTIRSEFYVETKNPNPNYISWCAKILKESGYYVVSIADCLDDHEWLAGSPPPADLQLHEGELNIMQVMALIKDASIVVTGPSFVVPATMAALTPLFVIFGGRGAYDNPHKLFDLRLDLSRTGWAIPDNFCRCDKQVHDCDKMISNLDSEFFNFMRRVS